MTVDSRAIESLISQWEQRIAQSTDNSYKDALGECVYELRNCINETFQEDFLNSVPPEEIEQWLLEQEADAYLASMEAHEPAA